MTLRELLDEYGFTERERLLEGLSQLKNVFSHYAVCCAPAVGDGGLDDPRVLSVADAGSVDAALLEIANGETSNMEFKSSLLIDRKRMEKDPGRTAQEYRSEDVLKSSLKTIAAFANSGGGTLYIGVQDDASLCGLEDDFSAANPRRADYDGWEQHLRNVISSRFSDGSALNAYVHTQLFTCDSKQVVRIQITGKSRLTFLKTGDTWNLYIRSGTQTNSIPYCDIEQHFLLARLY